MEFGTAAAREQAMEDYSLFRTHYRSRVLLWVFVAGVLLTAGWAVAKPMLASRAARAERIHAVLQARDAFERAANSCVAARAPHEYAMAKRYLELAMKELQDGGDTGLQELSATSIDYSNRAIEKTGIGCPSSGG